VRALEILTELFGGLDAETAKPLASAKPAEVRARAAWSLGRKQEAKSNIETILSFLNDDDPLVRRFALEALLGNAEALSYDQIRPALEREAAGTCRFNQQLLARVIGSLQISADDLKTIGPDTNTLPGLYGLFWLNHRDPTKGAFSPVGPLLALGSILPSAWKDPTAFVAQKLEIIRLAQLAFGDMGPAKDRPAVFDGYAPLANYVVPLEAWLHGWVRWNDVPKGLARLYPSGNEKVDYEFARLLAMIEPKDSGLLDRILANVTGESHPVDDIHHLIVAARIPVGRNAEQRENIAAALVNLEPKITARELNVDSNWDDRIGELYARLVELDPQLPGPVVAQPAFGRPGHTIFLAGLSSRQAAIAAFVEAIQSDNDYPWTSELVFLIGASDDPQHRELVRAQFDSFAVRDAVLQVLAKDPEPRDRRKFIAGLESSQLETLNACLGALARLGGGAEPAELVALLQTLRRLGNDRRESILREKVVRLLRERTGEQFGFVFGEAGHRPQGEAIEKWTAYLAERYPQQSAAALGSGEGDRDDLLAQLAEVDWSAADAERGRRLFEQRACGHCHGGRRALGPDLAGAAKRFARDDLFTAIVLPNRDVSPRYQTTLIQTVQGKVYAGLVIYEAVDGLILRDANNRTFRIEGPDIERRRSLPTSLMPAGLLKDLTPRDYADLYAYLLELDR
ncbi:MAG: HEAT repeat domain-containing protein, partial [Planctomycetaceae bacterium]